MKEVTEATYLGGIINKKLDITKNQLDELTSIINKLAEINNSVEYQKLTIRKNTKSIY